jgi:hypothetical protein
MAVDGQDYAQRLERAIAASGVKMIEASPVQPARVARRV